MNPSPQDPQSKILFTSQAAADTSSVFEHPRATSVVYQIEASGVTTGADIAIQHRAASGNWKTVHAANGSDADIEDPIVLVGRFDETRVVISNYTDGSYTISAKAI